MRRLTDMSCGASMQGFVLMEVMVAIVVLATLLTSLATGVQTALDASVALRDKAARLSAEGSHGPSSEAWEWGPMIQRAEWSAGPELSVRLGTGVGAAGTVGAWASGWLVGEWEVSAGEVLRLGPSTWYGVVGKELVIRSRSSSEGWGPPWRSLVPAGSGTNENSATARESPSALGFGEANIAIHGGSWNSPLLHASWADAPVSDSLCGVVFVPSACTAGVCRLESGGRMQWWLNCEGRRLDVYF
jgi:prepilin-type N-terminal cleavage/methylation domain-containing protein